MHECRLVLEADDNGRAIAHLYSVDAGPYSRALACAPVVRDQPVPRVPHGDVVRASARVKPKERAVFTCRDGTVVKPEGVLHWYVKWSF